jgi:hypothetical protein
MASKSLKLMTVLIASGADIAVSDFRGWGQSRGLLQAPKGLMLTHKRHSANENGGSEEPPSLN